MAPVMCIDQPEYPTLAKVCFTTPAIDNHAHNICKEETSHKYPIESVFSEAEGNALTNHAQTSIPGMTAANQLADLYLCESNCDHLKKTVLGQLTFEYRCGMCFTFSKIKMVLFDDLLIGTKEDCNDYRWHNQFTEKKNKRIVRLEVLMEDAIRSVFFGSNIKTEVDIKALHRCRDLFIREVYKSIMDTEVVAFKSIICYRSGLDVSPLTTPEEALKQLVPWIASLRNSSDDSTLRLNKETKNLNDWLLTKAFEEILTHPRGSDFILPVQFHVGLGDKSVQLTKSRPSYLQDLIEHFTDLPIVLLHACYPFTREAGYLASVYENVWLDFGEIFPMISTIGQISAVKEMFEICPTSKLLWSSDAHFLPEGFYLASCQARTVLYHVLVEMIKIKSMDENQAQEIVKRVLFLNSNGLYRLGLSLEESK